MSVIVMIGIIKISAHLETVSACSPPLDLSFLGSAWGPCLSYSSRCSHAWHRPGRERAVRIWWTKPWALFYRRRNRGPGRSRGFPKVTETVVRLRLEPRHSLSLSSVLARSRGENQRDKMLSYQTQTPGSPERDRHLV